MPASNSPSDLKSDSERRDCHRPTSRWLPTCLSIVFLTACVLIYFGPCLLSDQSFAFRDAAHFYRPLFQWINSEWAAGRIPLWNPWDDLGTPVIADGTSSVFYPGKLVFLLPLSFAANYKLYVVGHVILAAVNMFWAARQWSHSHTASVLAGLAYALGGSVLFQYCNCPYLVGAAWMPLALPLIESSIRQRRLTSQLNLAAITSLMILGGDPQAAYHTVLLLVGYWLFSSGRRAWRDVAGWSAIGVVISSCAILSAIQWVPSIQWTRHSERYFANDPRTIYELVAFSADDSNSSDAGDRYSGLLRRPQPETHHEKVFHFSIGYWRWAELFWPNFGGRMFPIHCRWLKALPAEGRVWTPSLYMGLLPILLAVGCVRFRGGSRRRRWLSWVAGVAALGAAGWYGLGWLWSEIGCAIWGDQFNTGVGPQVGGVYWWMTVCLPNYVLFRYPAKLWCVAAVALSLLASSGCDRLLRRPQQTPSKQLIALLTISAAAILALFAFKDCWSDGIAHAAPDPLFGPLDVELTWRYQLQCFGHVVVLALALLTLLAWLKRAQGGRPHIRYLLLVVTAIDLLIGQQWMLALVPESVWQPSVTVVSAASPNLSRGYRQDSTSWQSAEWKSSSSDDRLLELIQRDILTHRSRYHLTKHSARVDVGQSLRPMVMAEIMRLARIQGELSERHLAVLRNLGVAQVDRPDSTGSLNTRLESPLPRAWIVHHVDLTSSPVSPVPSGVNLYLESLLFPGGEPADFRKKIVVDLETVELPSLRKELEILSQQPAAFDATENVREGCAREGCLFQVYQPQRVELKVFLERPGVVVLADLYWPGWWAQSSSDHGTSQTELPIFRVNHLMRGVYLPAGRHRVQFHYRPTRFYAAAMVSLMAWLAWLGWLGSNLVVPFGRQLVGHFRPHA
jgi:hypothetical protein